MAEIPGRCPACSTPISPGATRCPGCGKIFVETPGPPAPSGTIVAARAGGGGLRLLGALLVGAGVLAAAAAAILVPGAAGIALAVLAGGAGVGLGALSLRTGARAGAHADRRERTERELAVLSLAEKSEGDLTTTETARALSMGLEETEQLLTAMADG